VIVDRKVAGQLGVSTAQVGQTLRRSVYGEKISTYKENKDDFEINVRFNEDLKNDNSAIFNQPVTFRDQASGRLQQVPIAALVEKTNTSSLNNIKLKSLRRVITVYSNILEGYNANEIVGALKKEMTTYKMPKDTNFAFTG